MFLLYFRCAESKSGEHGGAGDVDGFPDVSVNELVDELVERFEPEAIVSPWNAGSGFAGNGKNVTAEPRGTDAPGDPTP